jgi:hypothetical protein
MLAELRRELIIDVVVDHVNWKDDSYYGGSADLNYRWGDGNYGTPFLL